MDAYEPNHNFEYDDIILENPRPVQGGSYFTKISMNPNKQLYVQFPKCLTKQGVVSTKKGKYCDLMYERENETELVEWIEHLETKCHDLIDAKKNVWFHNDLAREDIESMMSPICRLYKSGKNILIRANIDTIKQSGKDKCVVYDENERLLDLDLDVITEERMIIPLVLIEGIKFTSKSFEVEIKLLQMMVLEPELEPIKTLRIKNPALAKASQEQAARAREQAAREQAAREKAAFWQAVHGQAARGQAAREQAAQTQAAQTQAAREQAAREQAAREQAAREQAVQTHVLAPLSENKEAILEEINLDIDSLDNSITLKKPNELYHQMYKVARQKAKQLRQVAVQAYLEAKQIKTKYMLSDDDDDEDDDEDDHDEDDSDIGNN
jgi:hypothetical protein